MNTPSVATAQRLLVLADKHRAPLAEFDFFAQHELLRIRWHGHITADSFVQVATAGLALFPNQPLPRRLLSDNSQTSGEWEDAIPWLHYEWLPQAAERGLAVIAHVVPTESETPLNKSAGGIEFMEAVQEVLRAHSFRSPATAWQWVLKHHLTAA
jgi:hypothetical protein